MKTIVVASIVSLIVGIGAGILIGAQTEPIVILEVEHVCLDGK